MTRNRSSPQFELNFMGLLTSDGNFPNSGQPRTCLDQGSAWGARLLPDGAQDARKSAGMAWTGRVCSAAGRQTVLCICVCALATGQSKGGRFRCEGHASSFATRIRHLDMHPITSAAAGKRAAQDSRMLRTPRFTGLTADRVLSGQRDEVG